MHAVESLAGTPSRSSRILFAAAFRGARISGHAPFGDINATLIARADARF